MEMVAICERREAKDEIQTVNTLYCGFVILE